jgi:flagellar basal body-associated protein FliL
MAANTAEPTPGPEEAPSQAPAPESTSGGFKAWLPLVLTVAFMPALAFAMTKFVLIPQLQKGLVVHAATPGDHAATGDKSKKEPATVKRETVIMNKLLVNVAGTMGARFLLVSLSIAGTGGEEFKKTMEDHDAQLKDKATSVLAMKTIADLEKPNARNLIRAELISGFNDILGNSSVQEIYFTEFAIQ